MTGVAEHRHAGLVPASTSGQVRGVRERQPSVYILASRFNGTLYIGVTANLIGRLMQHRSGIFGGFTKRYGVYMLVWFEMADTMEAAITVEKRMKKWRAAIRRI